MLYLLNKMLADFEKRACFRYLKEIGYTDTIIDVRSNRVRSLLGLSDQNVAGSVVGGKDDGNRTSGGVILGAGDGLVVNGGDSSGTTNVVNAGVGRRSMGDGGGVSGGGSGKRTAANSSVLAEEMMIDTEAAVMANFDFLSSEVRTITVFWLTKRQWPYIPASTRAI